MSPFAVIGDTYRAATSKAAQRTYIYAVLLAVTSSVLYGVAILGYLGFYREYLPHQVRSAPIHLQYGPSLPSLPSTASTKAGSRLFAAEATLQQHLQAGQAAHHVHHPFALADLRGLGLKTDQDYDVSIVLSVPRSPNNLGVGNFMVELALAASSVNSASTAITSAARLPPANPRDFLESGGKRVLFAAARPALMAYTDPLVTQATLFTLLPLHFFAPEAASRTRLIVPMAESLSFSGPGGPSAVLPAVLYLELRTNGGQELQTYGAEVVFAARLRGLRWLMYHHRIFSFLLLTTTWWLIEVVFMVAVFVVLGLVFSGSGDSKPITGRSETNTNNTPSLPAPGLPPRIKNEEESGEEWKGLEKKKPAEVEKKTPPNLKKEKQEEKFGKEASRLASIPTTVASSSNVKPAEKDTNVGAGEDKGKQNNKASAGTPTKPASNRKSIIGEPLEEGEGDDFDDDYDDDDYGDSDDNADEDEDGDVGEPPMPSTPTRRLNKPPSVAGSTASLKKAGKNKDTAVATGRSPPSSSDSPVRQRPSSREHPPKKEASNLSTASVTSTGQESPSRKKASQPVDQRQSKAP